MRRWKECILAGLISCFLAVPCLSLANDEKIPEGAGGGAIALQTDGKSDLLQAVRAKDYDKALQIVNGQIEAHPGDADATTAAAPFTPFWDAMTRPWPIVTRPFPWNRAQLPLFQPRRYL